MQLSYLSIQGRNAIEMKHKPNLEDLGGTLILKTRDKKKQREENILLYSIRQI